MHVTRFLSWDAVVRDIGPPVDVRWDARMVVALRGEQDVSTAARVAEALVGVSVVDEGDVVVDLSGVRFMDAAIVGVLVGGRHALRLQSRELTLRAPSKPARRVLELCGLVGLIDPASAVAADTSAS